eukprot:7844722-Prorocentrum_lima.AAC.1
MFQDLQGQGLVQVAHPPPLGRDVDGVPGSRQHGLAQSLHLDAANTPLCDLPQEPCRGPWQTLP